MDKMFQHLRKDNFQPVAARETEDKSSFEQKPKAEGKKEGGKQKGGSTEA